MVNPVQAGTCNLPLDAEEIKLILDYRAATKQRQKILRDAANHFNPRPHVRPALRLVLANGGNK